MMPSSNKKFAVPAKPMLSPIMLLKRLAPPQAIIHIGAGTGNGEIHQWQQWEVPHALIIDADQDRLDWAEPLVAERPGWQILNTVLADTEDEIGYYQATNPDEDGLIPPERLTKLWPNLRTITNGHRPGQRLDRLLSEESCAVFNQSIPIWTFIDCLPALPILKGAGVLIDQWSVLWLRVLLQPTSGIEAGAVLENIDAFLQPHGFRCVDITESNHPAIGYAIFVRDWQAVLTPQIDGLTQTNTALAEGKAALASRRDALETEVATLTQARDLQSKLAAEGQSRVQALTQERDSLAAQANERQAQIDTLTQTTAVLTEEKTSLAERRDALQSEVAALTQARDEKSQLAAKGQTGIQPLTQERDSHAKQAVERQAQIDALTQTAATLTEEKTALAALRDALQGEVATLTRVRDEQGKLAAESKTERESLQIQLKQKGSRITQLESELAEFVARQQLLNDEMIRAEAQIDLIKDVLLREPGL